MTTSELRATYLQQGTLARFRRRHLQLAWKTLQSFIIVAQRMKPTNYVITSDEFSGTLNRRVSSPSIVNKNGTVSAKIAPRSKCYKNASRLNRYNFLTDNAIDFLFSTLHTTPFHYEVLKIGSR